MIDLHLISVTRTALELEGQIVSEAQKVDVASLWGDTGQFRSSDCKSSALSPIVKDWEVEKAQLRGLGSTQHGERATLPGA